MAVSTEYLAVTGLHHIEGNPWYLRLVPDFVAPSVADIDFEELRDRLALLETDPLHAFFDLDGTIRRVGEDVVDPKTAQHLRQSLDADILTSATLTVNSKNPGIARFGWQIRSDVRSFTKLDTGHSKPSKCFYEHVIAEQRIAGEPIVVIGDKITRDILGARRMSAGVFSILVPRLGEADLTPDRIIGRRYDNTARRLGNWAMQVANRYKPAVDVV
jgi:FMN phosphatase YigB (HAD superfamily)